jgi:hypothetical protein
MKETPMHPAMRALLIVLVLAAALPVSAQAGASTRVELTRDERLSKQLTFPGDTLRLQEVIKAIHAATEVPLMVQGDLLRRPVVLAVKDRSASELLEDLRVLFGGTWVRRDDGYLLVTDEVTAKLVAAYPQETSTQQEEQALARSLNRVQWAALRESGVLPFAALTPAQRRLALTVLRDRYLREPDRYPSSIVVGKGVRLTVPRSDAAVRIGRPASMPPGTIFAGERVWELSLEVPAIQDNGSLQQEAVFGIPIQ